MGIVRCENCGWPYHKGECKPPPEEIAELAKTAHSACIRLLSAMLAGSEDAISRAIQETGDRLAGTGAVIDRLKE